MYRKILKHFSVFIPALLIAATLNASSKEQGVISGTVLEKDSGEPLFSANVLLLGTTLGSATDEEGRFRIVNIPHGDYVLQVSFIGYTTYEQHVHIDDEQELIISVEMELEPITGEQIVVTATRTRKSIVDVPIRTEIVPEAIISQSAEKNVLELLARQPGIKLQVDCSACNTAGLEINGLPTPYTKILVDGMPSSGGLGSIYGLWNISTSNMQQVEIVKGASSALYGTDAIAGTINIITKDPEEYPKLQVSMQGSDKKSRDFEINASREIENWGISANGFINTQEMLDLNNDDFSEYAAYSRFGGSSKLTRVLNENSKLFASGTFMYEDRLGGSTLASRRDIGIYDSIDRYLESIISERQEFRTGYSTVLNEDVNFAVKGQVINHDQDSYYGTRGYKAQQKQYYIEATADTDVNGYNLLFGTSFTQEKYNHTLNIGTGDDLSSFRYSRDYSIPGGIVQLNRIYEPWNTEIVLSGRYDHHSEHGNIWTPRVALRTNPVKNLAWRFSMGTGFRVSNPVTEDHEGVTGVVHVDQNLNLEPEKSKNINSTVTLNLPGTQHAFKAEVGGHYTTLDNFIIQTFTIEDGITIARMENVDDTAWISGFDLNLQYYGSNGLDMTIGYGYLNSEIDQFGEKHEFFFVPKHRLSLDLLYKIPSSNITVNLRNQVYGSQLYNYIDFGDIIEKGKRTPSYSMTDIKVDYELNERMSLFTGADNIFDYKQVDTDNPLVNATGEFNPGGFIWGPLQGRKVYAGFRLSY